jgi:4'-phosphopantetheinyl transferase
VLHPTLPADTVHVWRASLACSVDERAALHALLSTDERAKADAFRRPEDSRRYVVGRGLLRSLLGRYLDEEPAALRFGYGAFGKPFLGTSAEPGVLQFSVSHSHELAVFAVTDRLVGVDLERVRSDLSVNDLAKQTLSAGERSRLEMLARNDSLYSAFFRLWTCKEAYIKALGEGFMAKPEQMDLSAAMPMQMGLSREFVDERGTAWSFIWLAVAPGYLATVATAGAPCHIDCYDLR